MKVRQDFVTNSSSTSFIISVREDWNETNFLTAIGIEGKSPMNEVFRRLFEAIDENKCDIRIALEEYRSDCDSVRTFLQEEGFEEETIGIVEKMLAEKRTVYYGKLSSDGSSAAEAYFCMESFLVCEDDIYFNGRVGGW
jgi:hypothetical protein